MASTSFEQPCSPVSAKVVEQNAGAAGTATSWGARMMQNATSTPGFPVSPMKLFQAPINYLQRRVPDARWGRYSSWPKEENAGDASSSSSGAACYTSLRRRWPLRRWTLLELAWTAAFIIGSTVITNALDQRKEWWITPPLSLTMHDYVRGHTVGLIGFGLTASLMFLAGRRSKNRYYDLFFVQSVNRENRFDLEEGGVKTSGGNEDAEKTAEPCVNAVALGKPPSSTLLVEGSSTPTKRPPPPRAEDNTTSQNLHSAEVVIAKLNHEAATSKPRKREKHSAQQAAGQHDSSRSTSSTSSGEVFTTSSGVEIASPTPLLRTETQSTFADLQTTDATPSVGPRTLSDDLDAMELGEVERGHSSASTMSKVAQMNEEGGLGLGVPKSTSSCIEEDEEAVPASTEDSTKGEVVVQTQTATGTARKAGADARSDVSSIVPDLVHIDVDLLHVPPEHRDKNASQRDDWMSPLARSLLEAAKIGWQRVSEVAKRIDNGWKAFLRQMPDRYYHRLVFWTYLLSTPFLFGITFIVDSHDPIEGEYLPQHRAAHQSMSRGFFTFQLLHQGGFLLWNYCRREDLFLPTIRRVVRTRFFTKSEAAFLEHGTAGTELVERYEVQVRYIIRTYQPRVWRLRLAALVIGLYGAIFGYFVLMYVLCANSSCSPKKLQNMTGVNQYLCICSVILYNLSHPYDFLLWDA